RHDAFGIAFQIGYFSFGTNEAKVVAEEGTEVPAIVMIDGGSVLNAGNAHVELIVDHHADIGPEIGLAVPGHCGRGESRRSNCHTQRNLSHLAFPFKSYTGVLVIAACFAGNSNRGNNLLRGVRLVALAEHARIWRVFGSVL